MESRIIRSCLCMIFILVIYNIFSPSSAGKLVQCINGNHFGEFSIKERKDLSKFIHNFNGQDVFIIQDKVFSPLQCRVLDNEN